MNSLAKFTDIRHYPLHECLINPDWREMGHARVLVSRKKPNGRIAFGMFLVDLYCLGAKELMADENTTKSKYENFMKPMMYFDGTPVPCDPHLGHTIIYGGIRYARSLGFEPHEDFEAHKSILVPESEVAMDTSVQFGKDGKPFYVQGPEDDVDRILATLKKTVGEGNFGFVSAEDMGAGGEDDIDEMFDAFSSLAEGMGKKK